MKPRDGNGGVEASRLAETGKGTVEKKALARAVASAEGGAARVDVRTAVHGGSLSGDPGDPANSYAYNSISMRISLRTLVVGWVFQQSHSAPCCG